MAPDDPRMEWLEVVDAQDAVIGLERRGVIHARGLMHRSAQVLVFNSAGEVFLQKRSASKDEFPGLWDSSAAGHVNPGEGYADCARRELAEELGITEPVVLEPLFRIPASEATGWEHCSVFRCRYDGPMTLQRNEVDEGRWLPPAEVDGLVDDPGAPLTPAIRRIWRRISPGH
ncbi:MAG: NUDIX domain-containing protein [Xanthomonadales bacterium]